MKTVVPSGGTLHASLAVSLYRVEEAPYSSLRLVDLIYPYWILSFVREGMVTTQTRGQSFVAEAGQVMLHLPNIPFSERSETGGVHLWFGFDATLTAHNDLFHAYPLPPVLTLSDPTRYTQAFLRMLERWQSAAGIAQEMEGLASASELFGLLLTEWVQAGRPARPASLLTGQDRFYDLLRYMETHLSDHLTRDTLAARVHLHPGSFDRAFRAAYGLAPMRMLRDLRLRQARRLLETTDDTLETVADACGLGDAPALSRLFRAQFGMAPGQYRQNIRKTGLYGSAFPRDPEAK